MNAEHVAIAKQDMAAIDAWRDDHPGEVFDLSEANLRGADLNGANLQGADLRETDLSWADLHSAGLRGANLSHANLYRGRLSWAAMRWVNLRGANLAAADVGFADLREADLHNAIIYGANFSQANLYDAKGILSIGPGGSRGDMLYVVKHDKEPMVMTGCFWGSLSDFEVAVEREHGDGEHGRYYRALIEFVYAWWAA